MKKTAVMIGDIPAVIWGRASDKVYLYVHGKLSSKEYAEAFAEIAEQKGFQTLSFDLPAHGERSGREERCDVWTGTRDLAAAADYVYGKWSEVSLFACSLGAYFSLNVLKDRPIKNCLFQSPIVDMGHLVGKMMQWFGITPERLREEKEIDTPVDLMTWDYYCYVSQHPTDVWQHPTSILYGRKDDLQSFEVVSRFAENNGARLTVSETSAHAFMDEGDADIVREWMNSSV